MPAWISDIIAIAPWLGAILALLFGIGWLWQKIGPTLRRWGRILDRLTGVPADAATGQPEVLGLFERMDHQDQKLKEQSEATSAQTLAMAEQSAVLETIRHEVEFNNGSSVKDAVIRIEKKVDDHLNIPSTTINVNPPPAP